MEIISQQGQAHMGIIMPILEGYLDKPVSKSLAPEIADQIRESVVVFLGTLARHLSPDDPKVSLQLASFLQFCNSTY